MANLPVVEAKSTLTAAAEGDTDIIAIFQDKGKSPLPPKGPYGSWVEKLRKGDSFKGSVGDVAFVRFGGKGKAENVAFVGLGQPQELSEEKVRKAGGSLAAKLKAEKVKQIVVRADSWAGTKGLNAETEDWLIGRALAEGLLYGVYRFERHRGKNKGKEAKDAKLHPEKMSFHSAKKGLVSDISDELVDIVAAAECMNVTRDWSNEPGNFGYATAFAAEAKKHATRYGLKCTVLTEKDLKREKMDMLLSVNEGSTREPRVVILEYVPKGIKNPKTIALVGKGVTFDTGGISLKPGANMHEMKHDMTGAATMMGATLLAAKTEVQNRVVCILGFVENMPAGNATRPGDVVTARNGKTVEILNTDAEGRLVLGDILDYSQKFKPDVIVDAATLTGAVLIGLGNLCAGLMTNDDSVADLISRAADLEGEKVWQLPLHEEYTEQLKSQVADLANIGGRLAGTITAGAFLKEFVPKGISWAHLDIAGTAWDYPHKTYMPKKGASGAHVRTLARFIADF